MCAHAVDLAHLFGVKYVFRYVVIGFSMLVIFVFMFGGLVVIFGEWNLRLGVASFLHLFFLFFIP